MKTLLVVVLLASGLALTAPAAAQGPLPRAGNMSRAERRSLMSPEEAQRDEQLQIMEARTGNTSLSMDNTAPRAGQGKSSFKVRKFKDNSGTNKQTRGLSHPVGGVISQGKPLVHQHPNARPRRKWFLAF